MSERDGRAEGTDPGPAAAEPLRRRDEILQVMYWMRGESLLDDVAPADLRRFLTPPGEGAAGRLLEGDLESLADAALLERTADGRYRLTDRGAAEGGRRFADEFEGMTRQGHGACNDPACDCHELGPEACIHSSQPS